MSAWQPAGSERMSVARACVRQVRVDIPDGGCHHHDAHGPLLSEVVSECRC